MPTLGREFRLFFTSIPGIPQDTNLVGMAATAAAINYALFTRDIYLDFPVSEADLEFIRESIKINNTEVFVNRLCRRRYEFFQKKYLPEEDEITPEEAVGITRVHASEIIEDQMDRKKGKRVAVLSSGGKESLLSHAMFQELGENPIALFFNESGGHWRAAQDSCNVYSEKGYQVYRNWSNIDRFYSFMNRLMPILDPRAFRWADDYPVQLFTFPVYLLSFLPAVVEYGIGHLIMGNEFDDPGEMPPYRNIKHFYGIYDQSVAFQAKFTSYMKKKGIDCELWSPIYNIYGSVVEDILARRYHDHYVLQRSCHSCHYDEHGNVVPCGKCSKCVGVRMFIDYAGADPSEIFYPKQGLADEIAGAGLKLDPSEIEFLEEGLTTGTYRKDSHIRGIHISSLEKAPFSAIPEKFRDGIHGILKEYTNGFWSQGKNGWNRVK